MAAGAMQALIAAAAAHESPAKACLPGALGRTLVTIADALETVADFPLKEAIDAADLWAAQTGTGQWQHSSWFVHERQGP